jgi:hypothetical protein
MPRGIIATNVPSQEFKNARESIILAVRIEGLRPYRFLGTDFNIPFGRYVGSYRCKESECGEFFN